MRKKVYVVFSADFLHNGHIKILKKASSLGKVIVGVLTDEAISTFKTIPLLSFEQRLLLFKNLKYVDEVIAQKTLDYRPNLKKLKPERDCRTQFIYLANQAPNRLNNIHHPLK